MKTYLDCSTVLIVTSQFVAMYSTYLQCIRFKVDLAWLVCNSLKSLFASIPNDFAMILVPSYSALSAAHVLFQLNETKFKIR